MQTCHKDYCDTSLPLPALAPVQGRVVSTGEAVSTEVPALQACGDQELGAASSRGSAFCKRLSVL